jgi:hypothetical protein
VENSASVRTPQTPQVAADGLDKMICLLNRRRCRLAIDLCVRVVGDETDLVRLPQRSTVLRGNTAGLDEMKTEGGDKPAMSLDHLRFDGIIAGKQCRACGIVDFLPIHGYHFLPIDG